MIRVYPVPYQEHECGRQTPDDRNPSIAVIIIILPVIIILIPVIIIILPITTTLIIGSFNVLGEILDAVYLYNH